MGFRDTDIDKLLIAGLIADAAADVAARRRSGRDALAAAHNSRPRRPPKRVRKRRFALPGRRAHDA